MINRVLLYNSGGVIGDAIQLIPLINTLKIELKNAKFFYLCSHANHFNTSLKDLNCPIETLDLDLKYFGFRWWHIFAVKKKIKEKKIKKFDLIIDLQSKIRNTLILKLIPHNFLISSCFNFRLSKPIIKVVKKDKVNDTMLSAINSLLKTNYKIIGYDVKNIENKFFQESSKLLPQKNYVGLSITQGNIYRKKEWSINNIVDLCNGLKSNNKIPVFFIEKKNKELKDKINQLVPGSLFPEHETNLSSAALVTCLGRRLDFAVSIDNGVMHMLSLGEIPMIVLFGPTNSKKFAPDYKKLVVLDSKLIKKTSNVSSINAEDVLEVAKQHSSFSY